MKTITKTLVLSVVVSLPVVGGLIFWAPQASAATISVDMTAHEDSEPGAGAGCSYYEAMQAANTNAAYGGCSAGDDGEDTIDLPAGTYDTSSVFGSYEDSIRVIGDPAGGTFFEGQAVSFYPNQTGETYLIQDITIQNGVSTGIDASINANDTAITIRRVTIRDSADIGISYYKYLGVPGTITIEDSLIENAGSDGIYSYECGQGGTMHIINTLVTGSTSNGLYNGCGHADVESSTFSNNGQDGIYNSHILDLTNVTLHNNNESGLELAPEEGFGDLNGEAHLTNVTITNNQGSGIYSEVIGTEEDYAEFAIYNTLIADNGNPACTTDILNLAEGDHNMATDGSCEEMFAESDAVTEVSNARLASSLADNGGSTTIGSAGLDGNVLTLALLAGSPAIDAGNDDVCPITDERDAGRPDGNACDIGAYESPFSTASVTEDEETTETLADTGQSELLFAIAAGFFISTGSVALYKSRYI